MHLFDSNSTVPAGADLHGYNKGIGHAFVVTDDGEEELGNSSGNLKVDKSNSGDFDAPLSAAPEKNCPERRKPYKRGSTQSVRRASVEPAVHEEAEIANMRDFFDEELQVPLVYSLQEGGISRLPSSEQLETDYFGTPVVLAPVQIERRESLNSSHGVGAEEYEAVELAEGADESNTQVGAQGAGLASEGEPQRHDRDSSSTLDSTVVGTENSDIQGEDTGSKVVKEGRMRRLKSCKDSMELINMKEAKSKAKQVQLPRVSGAQVVSVQGDKVLTPFDTSQDDEEDMVRKRSVVFTVDEHTGMHVSNLDAENAAKLEPNASFRENRKKSESMEKWVPRSEPTAPLSSEQSHGSNGSHISYDSSANLKSSEPRPPETAPKPAVCSPRQKCLEKSLEHNSSEV